MKKYEFTLNVAKLIMWINDQGWKAFIDYALRSDEEQMRLFKAGLSQCDGKNTISAHQYGKGEGFAVDMYIADKDWDIGKRELYEKAHKYWETIGGKPEIKWDVAHFEVK